MFDETRLGSAKFDTLEFEVRSRRPRVRCSVSQSVARGKRSPQEVEEVSKRARKHSKRDITEKETETEQGEEKKR